VRIICDDSRGLPNHNNPTLTPELLMLRRLIRQSTNGAWLGQLLNPIDADKETFKKIIRKSKSAFRK